MGNFCGNCGAELKINEKFCYNCGRQAGLAEQKTVAKFSFKTLFKQYLLWRFRGFLVCIIILSIASIGFMFMQKTGLINNAVAVEKPQDKAVAVEQKAEPKVKQKAPGKPVEESLIEDYLTYKNSRFGFSIDYPGKFVPGKPPANGDGQSFTSSDGRATLSISGGNISGRTIKDLFDSTIKNITGELGYTTLQDTWFVVTWKQDDKIYYKKVFVGTGSYNGFTFGYPDNQKGHYDNIVTTIERSFKPGNINIAG